MVPGLSVPCRLAGCRGPRYFHLGVGMGSPGCTVSALSSICDVEHNWVPERNRSGTGASCSECSGTPLQTNTRILKCLRRKPTRCIWEHARRHTHPCKCPDPLVRDPTARVFPAALLFTKRTARRMKCVQMAAASRKRTYEGGNVPNYSGVTVAAFVNLAPFQNKYGTFTRVENALWILHCD